MKKTLWLLLLVSGNAVAVGQAWVDGQQAASGNLGRSAGAVTPSNAANIGSTHNDTATVDNLKSNFAASNAGNAGLSSFGDAKVASCQNYVPNPNMPARDQECEAVNALKSTPANNASAITGITKSDPMFTNPNNMVNLGLNSSGTQTGIGSGTGQSGVTGAGACVQATSTTPAQFTEQTCTRAAAPANRTCTKVVSPSVTSTKTCNISGNIYVNATPDAHNVSGPSYGQSKNIINGKYRLTFSCDPNIGGIGNVEFGPDAIFPDSPRGPYNVVWWANGSWGVHWQATKKVPFSPGTPQTWGPYKMMQGSGSCGQPYGRDHYIHYDGTNWYVTESGNAFDFCFLSGGSNLGWQHDDYGFCAPGYSYVSGTVVQSKCKGTRRQCQDYTPTQYRLQSYCSTASDPAIVSAINNVCPAGSSQYNPLNIGNGCIKNFPHYYIPNVNPPVDRGMRHFGKAAGTYNGFVGIKNVYSQTINDSCATYQAATQNPSSVPATSVNGQLACPAGKILSGLNCI